MPFLLRIGCYLLRQPEKVRDLVRGVKDRLGWNYPISVKIRIDKDLKWVLGARLSSTVRPRLTVSRPPKIHRAARQHWCVRPCAFCSTSADDFMLTQPAAIQAGASHLTIHGRTRLEPSTVAPSLPGIAFAASLAHAQGVPTIGNGDIWTAQDAVDMRRETGVKGVMAARGLLANPALFSGYDKTPREAVEVRTERCGRQAPLRD
jgi:tRNA-dihydrouridine synthase 4